MKVGCREAELVAAMVAFDHGAAQCVGVSEQSVGCRYVALLLQQLAYARRTDCLPVAGECLGTHDIDAQ